MDRDQLLERLNSLHPVVLYPTMTFDMGLECTIVTNEGVVYPVPGMLLFCGGNWPIRKLSLADKGFLQWKNVFCLSKSEEQDAIFTESVELESAFVEMFDIDNRWEEMNDDELSNWLEIIHSDGMNIMEMSEIWEKQVSDIEK